MAIKSGKNAVFSEINITPLTDIFLVLLIIMMVIAPAFQSIDNSITVPEVNSGVSVEQGKVVVSVTKDGTIYIDSKKVSASSLAAELEAVKGDAESPEIVVRADEKVKSSVIMTIMDAAQDANYKKLIVAGEPLNKKDQKKLEKEAEKNVVSNAPKTAPKIKSNTLDGATTALPQDTQYDNW